MNPASRPPILRLAKGPKLLKQKPPRAKHARGFGTMEMAVPGRRSSSFLHFFGTFAAHFGENVNVQTQSFSQRYISPDVAWSRVSRNYKLAFIRVVGCGRRCWGRSGQSAALLSRTLGRHGPWLHDCPVCGQHGCFHREPWSRHPLPDGAHSWRAHRLSSGAAAGRTSCGSWSWRAEAIWILF